MKIAIVDDEISEQDLLDKYIHEWALQKKALVETQRFHNSESFLFSWEDDRQYDLLVLDIEMGKMNGLELAKKIRKENEEIPIVFVTGYEEYMQYGYDVAALHYLIKPVNKEKFFSVLEKISKKPASAPKQLFMTNEGSRSIGLDRILYIEAAGHGSILHLENETVNLREPLGSIESKLGGQNGYVKCHRAYIVNMQFVSMIFHSEVQLDNNERIPVSRGQLKNVQKEFLRFYKGV